MGPCLGADGPHVGKIWALAWELVAHIGKIWALAWELVAHIGKM